MVNAKKQHPKLGGFEERLVQVCPEAIYGLIPGNKLVRVCNSDCFTCSVKHERPAY